ncbi:hypothetical protein [Leptolyngbya sp. O-77]|uniref:hypothetical protein n=1 Tax=Leptolyngbya sp. O-77 TaxID=1080068 RepID=UPI0012E3B75A|nr:hypothetical protein [Leptolyngbya sp. O-77]
MEQAVAPTPANSPTSSSPAPPIMPDNGSASSANPALSASPAGELPAPPPVDTPNAPPHEQSAIATPGKEGWVALSNLRPLMMPNPTLTDAQRGVCNPASTTPPATPTPATPTPDLPAPPPALPPVGPATPPSAPPGASPRGVG